MVYFRVCCAATWLIATAVLAINWWFDEPLARAGQWTLAYAVLYVLVRLVLQAVDEIEHAGMRRYRHLDRRPQI